MLRVDAGIVTRRSVASLAAGDRTAAKSWHIPTAKIAEAGLRDNRESRNSRNDSRSKTNGGTLFAYVILRLLLTHALTPWENTMALKSLQDLLVEELKDLYSAENQLVKALPKMAKGATNPDLKAGFQEHLEQTRNQVKRLEQACQCLEASPRGKKCAAMEGLIEEGKELLQEEAEAAVLDAALIAAAQKVEHYEIASYGSARQWAEQLGLDEVAELLQETLDEEKATDEKLTELALSAVNETAEEEGQEEPLANNKRAAR
jgi:ferritin-like metal-binding protein YciE